MMDVSIKAPLQRRAGAQNVSMDRSFAPSHSEKLESTLRHMDPALPKKGSTPLVTYNVVVNNRWTVHRTSMRLDVTSWLLLDHIAEAEGYANRDVLISAVHERFHADELPLTALVRLFLQTYTAPVAVLDFLGRERRANGRGFAADRTRN
ncbi:Ribbon-helix-helix domain-containing protein [Azospirillum oryzae]|uniref:Ribbon-helix-helix domain-containing protein n=1 Tax=Azospirillum oryzae TaxID=286727 RepID=A0A1X7GND3_9PROT|nr:ribbon-helix-helix domain-containing protein [Azospirillum oryzae]SMF72171.1 Ribbon-helix-helix domain-containing protein [Azospirillum oryzae]